MDMDLSRYGDVCLCLSVMLGCWGIEQNAWLLEHKSMRCLCDHQVI